MNNPLIIWLISQGGKPSNISWTELANDERFKSGIGGDTDRRRGQNAMKQWLRFLGTDRGLEFKKATIGSDGEVISYQMGRAGEPKEIPDTEGLELKFVTQTPNGGAYIRHERPKDKKLSKDDIIGLLKESAETPVQIKEWTQEDLETARTQIVKVSDVHVGMAIKDGSFGHTWNIKKLRQRTDFLLDYIDKDARKLVFMFGGDVADGQDGKTTRGGHLLPQNLNSKDQLRQSKDWLLYILDSVTKITEAEIEVYWVANSNHGGLLDFATGEILKTVVPYRYDGQVKFVNQEEFIAAYKIDGFSFMLAHGKDEEIISRGWPRFFGKNQFDFVEEFIRYKRLKNPVLIRGDQHQYSDILYKQFRDIMIPAFSPPSSWVSTNFASVYQGGFVIGTIEDGELSFKLISFKK